MLNSSGYHSRLTVQRHYLIEFYGFRRWLCVSNCRETGPRWLWFVAEANEEICELLLATSNALPDPREVKIHLYLDLCIYFFYNCYFCLSAGFKRLEGLLEANHQYLCLLGVMCDWLNIHYNRVWGNHCFLPFCCILSTREISWHEWLKVLFFNRLLSSDALCLTRSYCVLLVPPAISVIAVYR